MGVKGRSNLFYVVCYLIIANLFGLTHASKENEVVVDMEQAKSSPQIRFVGDEESNVKASRELQPEEDDTDDDDTDNEDDDDDADSVITDDDLDTDDDDDDDDVNDDDDNQAALIGGVAGLVLGGTALYYFSTGRSKKNLPEKSDSLPVVNPGGSPPPRTGMQMPWQSQASTMMSAASYPTQAYSQMQLESTIMQQSQALAHQQRVIQAQQQQMASQISSVDPLGSHIPRSNETVIQLKESAKPRLDSMGFERGISFRMDNPYPAKEPRPSNERRR